MSPRPRIAIIDDHEVVVLALGTALSDHDSLEFVGSATTVAALLSQRLRADLVVLDLSLRDGSTPADNVTALTASGTSVIVLTAGENPYLIREVSRTDALGIIRKSAPVDEILAALELAAHGNAIATTEWASALDSDPDLGGAPLTERERDVLSLYASGLGAKSVATRLDISENTVDDHIRRIRSVYRQIGRPADTKVDLYRRGLEDGFLPLPTDG